ncbi:PQQ-binding-like beta-propeller repeat protein [Halomarina salina]|uniref:PQQ-binding-like beta-propeller repeat protein n=1 Tax=Halomarina salina TaxID=1872699 RepID=A0ABD5RP93_9EURY|nr:PQQ-like beta-propeller repeat protein [Halomarina salina]
MSPSRRQVLATCGVALTAGCSSVPSFSDDDGDDQSTPEAPVPFLHEPTDWPQPNYDAANTNAAPAEAAPDGPLQRTWSASFDSRDVGHQATPVVADGQVYLTQVVDYGRRFPIRLLAIDARTGAERWRFVQGGDDAAIVGPQATVAGETVFVDATSDDGTTLYALNAADGQVLWSKRFDLRQARTAVPAHGLVHVSEPLAERDESRFAALDPRTGEQWWAQDVAGSIPWMATVGPDDVYYGQFAGDGEDHLLAFDARSGERRWGSTQPTQETVPFHDGRLYTLTPTGEEQLHTRLDAFDVDRRESVWSVEHDLGTTDDESGRDRGEFTVGAVTDDVVLTCVGFYGVDPDRVVAYDTATGDQRWEFVGEDEGGGDVYSTPTVAGDRLYLTHTQWGREGASLRVFDLASGERQATYDLPPDAVGEPVVAGGRLYVQTEHGVVAFESE